MNINVLKDWSYSRRYFLTHPWKIVEECWINLKNAHMRATKGYCWPDVWNINDWMLEILPQMFRTMADKGAAYPGIVPFDTPEKWHDWLHSVADVLESLREENWESKNEYAEQFHQLSELHQRNKTSSKFITVTWDDDKELNDVKELYLIRQAELAEERQKLLQDTFNQIGRYFDYLWD